ncbi:MAG: hypothetical protein J5449_05445 [Oscillospiraceae bacterium]|nr:hypothetical protein [Oscillospiraceae bacterium]
MGLFDKLTSNENVSGYKKYDNKNGWTTADLLEKLSGVQTSFGEPKMGKAKVLGKDFDAVIYSDASETSDIYVKTDGKKIEIGFSTKPGASKDVMKNALMAGALGVGNADQNAVNRYIDELGGVMEKLLAGQSVTETAGTNALDSTDAYKLYMEENFKLLSDKYSICTEDQEPVFYVSGDLMGMSYKIMDANENEIMVIKKKLVAITPEYTVSEGKKEIGHFKKKLTLGRPEINGNINGMEVKIKGDVLGNCFDILGNGKPIGNVDHAQLLWGNCYSIATFEKSMVNSVVAIAVICEAIAKAEDSN